MVSEKRGYPSDLTDEQWAVLEPLLPKPKKRAGGPGRPAYDRRTVVNALRYVDKSACHWRMLPHDFGHWSTVYGYFNRWSKSGLWKRVVDALVKQERKRQERRAEPSAGCIDSQSVKTSSQGGISGYDAGKQVKGRKRHLLVDTLGLILMVVVSAASEDDRSGLQMLLVKYFAPGIRRLRHIWVDGGYSGAPIAEWAAALKRSWKIVLEVVERTGKGFNVLKRRWVVERTFSWLGNFRRLSKDHERLPRNSEAMIQLAMIGILLRRLA